LSSELARTALSLSPRTTGTICDSPKTVKPFSFNFPRKYAALAKSVFARPLSFLATLIGLALSYTGQVTIKVIIVPLLFLFFMIPLPGIFLFRLSSELQLISSQLGVFFIRLFGISVYLEGNVIDLGVYKLQVVEACSGLRYLFPMMSLAFIAAYFFQVKFWIRAVIFLSSIPITIIMNSFRIGVIGILVEYWGIEQAEGFLHDFEGWAVFMFSLAIMLFEMWLFVILSKDRKPLREVFGIDFPEPAPGDAIINIRKVSPPLYGVTFLLLVSLFVTIGIGQREKVVLVRKDFSQFPMEINGWLGQKSRIDRDALDLLKLDDYLMADYTRETSAGDIEAMNLYSAYYNQQEAGAAAHSPKTCLPGGGWRIEESSEEFLPYVGTNPGGLLVNRFVIKKGEQSQIVYYWFQQRGRIIASEYMVKWYLLLDSIKYGRTDGALVRLTTLVRPGEDVAKADTRLAKFAKLIQPVLSEYIPE